MNDLKQKHNLLISEVFNRAADQYGSVGPNYFRYFGNKIVEYAGINRGQVVLDVACGRGASIFPAHDRIGISGKVIGIDLARDMLKNIKLEIEDSSFDNIELQEMDAEVLTFASNTFDVVLCGFGLFYLPDLEKALGEIKRVLKPGGIFVTSTFGERDKRWAPFRELIVSTQKNLEPISLVQTKILDSKDEITLYFKEAGFEKINIFQEEKEIYYKDETDWWQTMWSQGYRGFLERLNEQTLNEFKDESFKIISNIRTEHGIPENFSVLITKAIKTNIT
ncbi:MAG: class I SAM-dependent methyltransferase [Calditrichaceae bacterium]